MYWVIGKIEQQLAGEIRAFSAVKKSFVLAADGYGTFPVKRVPFCGDAASAAGFLFVFANSTAEPASGIYCEFIHHLSFGPVISTGWVFSRINYMAV